MQTADPSGSLSGSAPSARQGDFFPAHHSFASLDIPADRIGVIDVGSNSVRLVVYEGGRRSPATMFNEKIMCRLGARLTESGRLDPEGSRRAVTALRRFAAIATRLHVGALAAVATAAVRDAEDGEEFCKEVEAATQIRLEVISGADEARLSAQGVLFGNPGASGVVVDLGGASLELCRIEAGRTGKGISAPIGPLRVPRRKSGKRKGVSDPIAEGLAPYVDEFRLDGARLYLVGGSWRALARANIARTAYPLRVLHEYVMGAGEAQALADWAVNARPETLDELAFVSESRAPLMPLAGRILGHLLRTLRPGDVLVSGYGLREGICLEHLPPPLRRQDPLIAACEMQEELRARAPGFGRELAAWVKQVIPPVDQHEDRLIEAAARLADVGWRTHPDYRVAASWETVTRSTLTDIGHEGRVFLGAILSSRYKRNRRALEESGLIGLLAPGRVDRAVRYGLAFRLGVVLAAASPGVLAGCRVDLKPGRLGLSLSGSAAELAGEEVDKRMRQLARELGLEAKLSFA